MKGSKGLLLVARRELVERGRERSFLISTVVTLLILVAFALAPRLFGFGDPTRYEVGLVGDTPVGLREAVAAQEESFDIEVAFESLRDVSAAERAVAEGEIDVALVDGAQVIVETSVPRELEAALQAAAAQTRLTTSLAGLGVPAEEVAALLSTQPFEARALEPESGGDGAAAAIAFFGVFILYGQLFTYGYWIAAGVVEEKSSRIVEILLSTIRPRQLLAGKILGIGVLGLGQLLLIVALGVGVVVVTGVVDLPPGAAGAIVQVLLWFVLGYAFYSCAFAVAGAVVSRQEELQNTMTPLSITILVSFFLAFQALTAPDSTLARVASFVPPVAPLVMPPRVILGAVTAGEIVGAAVLTLLATAVLIALATRVYAGAVLRTGARVPLRDAWRSARSYEVSE